MSHDWSSYKLWWAQLVDLVQDQQGIWNQNSLCVYVLFWFLLHEHIVILNLLTLSIEMEISPFKLGIHLHWWCQSVSSNGDAKVKQVKPALIEWCMMQNNIPIIPSFGETATGQIVQLHMWDVTSAVARQLQPLKVIKVNCHGGFQDEKQQVPMLW